MLPQKFRIKGRTRIPKILQRGEKKFGKYLLCRYQYDDVKTIDNNIHIGILVSKKIHKKAVDRNRLRRQLSEISRIFLNEHKDFQKTPNIVILPLVSVKKASLQDMKDDLNYLLTKI